MSTKWTFEDIGNKRGVYSGEDCMKTFCKSLREYAIIITNFKNKKNNTINKQIIYESYLNPADNHIYKKTFGNKC